MSRSRPDHQPAHGRSDPAPIFIAAKDCLLAGLLLLTAASACAQPAMSLCERAGHEAEQRYALPAGLLAAIGRVESGQWDLSLGRVVPSPWAIDAAGQSDLADSKQAALDHMRQLQANGVRNIDVGCFQINLQAHPFAFADLDQAFDPGANAQYAARFLTLLHARLGNWEDAVAAYHSAAPERGVPYRQLVFANWSAPEGWQHALSGAPALARPSEPVRVFSIGGSEIRVWTPSAAGSAASFIAIAGVSPGPLPRVIAGTPGQRRPGT
ncbi:MAG TPA: transglycosylase SLT domain-containing protein [Acetobacteraceae bacterium]